MLARLEILDSDDESENKENKELIYRIQKTITSRPTTWNSKATVNSNEMKQFEKMIM